MKNFKYWLNEQEQDNDTQKSAASSTFTSPNRYLNDPSAANSALYQKWANYRQNQVQQGQAAHDLSIFDTYNQIANTIKSIDKSNYRHNRLIAMLHRGLGENYNMPTTIISQSVDMHDLYQLEKDLIATQKQASSNEYAIKDILKRQGIDMHKHIRRAAGFKGMAENDQTMDYSPSFKTSQNNNSQQLGLDGPKFFQSAGHLSNEISRVSAQTEKTKDLIYALYHKTGGTPQPYQPDPQSVLD